MSHKLFVESDFFLTCIFPISERRCALGNGKRKDCGYDGIGKDNCEKAGCCWSENPHTPNCYVMAEGKETDGKDCLITTVTFQIIKTNKKKNVSSKKLKHLPTKLQEPFTIYNNRFSTKIRFVRRR